MSATTVYSVVYTQGAPSPATYTYPTPFTSPLPLSSKVDRVNIRVATGPHAISSASTGNIDAYYGPPRGGPSSRSPFLSRSRTRRSCVGGAFIPLPPQVPSKTETVIHPLLQQCPGNIDLRQPWERVQADWGSTLDDVATNPLLPSLAITNPLLQWPIVVQRSGDRAYVTVGDVLRTMWAFFQIPLTHESTPEAASFGPKRMRMSEIASLERNHQQAAACRVALMMGQTSFVGLSKARGEADTWVLRVTSGF